MGDDPPLKAPKRRGNGKAYLEPQGMSANRWKRWGAGPEAVGRPPSRNAGPSYARSAV